MKKARALLLIAFFFGCLASGFTQKIDTLVFDNGNIVTGEIKWIEQGIVKYKTTAAGTIDVKWERVKLIKSTRMFDIRTDEGGRYFGSFLFGSEDYFVKIKLINDFIEFPISDIVDVHALRRNFWTRLDGSVDIGFNYTKASDVTQFNLAGVVDYWGEKWSSTLTVNSIITAQPDRDQSRRQDASIQLNRFLKKRYNVLALLGVNQNTELGLDLRALISLGASKELFYTRRNYLQTIAGLSINREWTNSYDSTTNNLEGFAGLVFKKYKLISPKIDISSYIITYPSLSNLGRVRLNLEVKAKFEIVSDLFIGLTFYDNFDNRPSGENAARNDWGIITSVGYTF